MIATLPVARVRGGAAAHYVDEYRYQPGRTICGRGLSETDEVCIALDLPLCRVCVSARDGYPTELEFREYHACTDCGVDNWTLGEVGYTVRDRVWRTAYPLYAQGVGVGSSRACIGCLERRLGRVLVADDFILPLGPEPGLSARLNRRVGRALEDSSASHVEATETDMNKPLQGGRGRRRLPGWLRRCRGTAMQGNWVR